MVGGWERLKVVLVTVVVREELTLAILDTTGSVEHTDVAGYGGKTAPLERGRGKVGFAAIPRVWPTPGKLSAGAAGAAGASEAAGAAEAAALAAW